MVVLEFILSVIINGLSQGGIYAMIAIGYTMVYGIAKMLNFAHGDIIMVAAYVIVSVTTQQALPSAASIPISFVLSVVICVLLGVVIEKVAYKPLRGASPLAVLITAIGVSYLLQSVAQSQTSVGQNMTTVFASFGGFKIFDVTVKYTSIITLVITIAVMVGLTMFVKKSRTGRAMVAVSEDRGASQLMGINVNKIITITFIIGSALAALAGFCSIMEAPSVTSTYGSMPGIKAFTAAVIGGIGSIPGAMLGGILLGLIEAISFKIPAFTPYTTAIEFAILIIVLLVKPTGFLGKKRREKV